MTDEFPLWTGPAAPHVEQDLEDAPLLIGRFAATEKLAPNDTGETIDFVRHQRAIDSDDWYRRCLSLQRQARGLSAVYPTALSAMFATPKSERVTALKDWRRGMVGYSYDPRIPGTAGHIFTVLQDGNKFADPITGTNDAREAGHVDYVRLSFYKGQWGQNVTFAATWLNGYDFADFNKPPEPVHKGTLGERYAKAIEELEKIERQKRNKGWTKVADALLRDIARMNRKLERFGG